MEIIRGKTTSLMNTAALRECTAAYSTIHIDIGTGDGRFVQRMAQSCPNMFVIGVDACRENLHEVSHRAPDNTLFVIANAQNLPHELSGLAAQVTINFPWGSLIAGLLVDDPATMTGLAAVMRPGASLEVRLNGGALSEASWSLEQGANRVREVLAMNGFHVKSSQALTAQDLKAYPTTWAKRLAYGRDPRAVLLRGIRQKIVLAEPA